MAKFNTKKEIQESTFADFGKLPPQAVDVEKAILGTILTDANAIFQVNAILTAEMFYSEAHRNIYEACLTLNKTNAPIDISTIPEALKKAEKLESVGGVFAIAELTHFATYGNIEYHAKVVMQKFIQRQVIKFASQAIKKCFDESENIFEIIDEISDNLIAINNHLLEDSNLSWQESTENYVIDIQEKAKNGIVETGIRIDLKEVDATVSGFREGLCIIAGRPSMGKTAFAIEVSCRIAEQKKGKVGIFSLEMSTPQLTNRIVARYSRINQTRLINANLYNGEINDLIKGGGEASMLDFLINDKSTISIQQIMSKAKVWAQKNKLAAIVVDYIQLVKGTKQQRHLEIGEISKGLKALSKDLSIPVFGLAQLGREKDAGKSLPTMSELRESGDLEQDADLIMLLYRPEYYGIEFDVDGVSTKGLTKVIIPKNRNGAVNLKGANLRSDLSINRYEDWEQEKPTNQLQLEPTQPKLIKVNNGRDDEDFSPF